MLLLARMAPHNSQSKSNKKKVLEVLSRNVKTVGYSAIFTFCAWGLIVWRRFPKITHG